MLADGGVGVGEDHALAGEILLEGAVDDLALKLRLDPGEINKYDFRTDSPAVFKARKGLDAAIVSQISEMKREPAWMRDFRLKSLEIFNAKPMPHWGGDIAVDFQDIF
ncbi:MAG: hypothetical protein ACKOWG_19975, partial [Planctomycetia bacterium]